MENFTKQSKRYSAINIKLSSCLQVGCILCTQSEKKADKYTKNALNTIIMLQPLQLTYHVRIFIWICDTNVCQLYVQVLVHRMQCATYAETNTFPGV
jgi:hypothetical protein